MTDTQIMAGAVDAALAAREDGHTHESACLNCGTVLVGSHCHACGQAAHVHRTLGAFFHDLLHGVFHFEGKIWHTLPLLVARPGRLTRRYIDGQRASFVSPLALFLFCVFVMFTVIHQTAESSENEPAVRVEQKSDAAIQTQIAQLKARRTDLVRGGQSTEAVDAQIDRLTTEQEIKQEMRGADYAGLHTDSDIAAFDSAIKKFKANPSLALYKAQNTAYKYSWALIPISVPFLWVLFPFSRRFHLYDHTVFVTYSLCFMTLLAVAAMIISALGAPGLAGLLMVVPPVHMYRQLRGTYGCSRIGGVLRTAALSVFAFVALLLFVILIAAETGA